MPEVQIVVTVLAIGFVCGILATLVVQGLFKTPQPPKIIVENQADYDSQWWLRGDPPPF